jgi:hypothetical protein
LHLPPLDSFTAKGIAQTQLSASSLPAIYALGNTEEAKNELTKAISMNEGFKLRANEDPAFEFLYGADPTS